MVHALKDAGRPLKTFELRSLTKEVAWGSNPSLTMSKFVNKSNGQIVRIERGLYQFYDKD